MMKFILGALILFNTMILFAQDEAGVVIPPRVSIISSSSFFERTVVSESSHRSIPGSNISYPALTKLISHHYSFRIALIVRDKGNTILLPLNVRITSPVNNSRIYTLLEDISVLNPEKIYDFDIDVNTDDTGWFIVDLVSCDNLTDKQDPLMNVVYDQTKVYFKR